MIALLIILGAAGAAAAAYALSGSSTSNNVTAFPVSPPLPAPVPATFVNSDNGSGGQENNLTVSSRGDSLPPQNRAVAPLVIVPSVFKPATKTSFTK